MVARKQAAPKFVIVDRREGESTLATLLRGLLRYREQGRRENPQLRPWSGTRLRELLRCGWSRYQKALEELGHPGELDLDEKGKRIRVPGWLLDVGLDSTAVLVAAHADQRHRSLQKAIQAKGRDAVFIPTLRTWAKDLHLLGKGGSCTTVESAWKRVKDAGIGKEVPRWPQVERRIRRNPVRQQRGSEPSPSSDKNLSIVVQDPLQERTRTSPSSYTTPKANEGLKTPQSADADSAALVERVSAFLIERGIRGLCPQEVRQAEAQHVAELLIHQRAHPMDWQNFLLLWDDAARESDGDPMGLFLDRIDTGRAFPLLAELQSQAREADTKRAAGAQIEEQEIFEAPLGTEPSTTNSIGPHLGEIGLAKESDDEDEDSHDAADDPPERQRTAVVDGHRLDARGEERGLVPPAVRNGLHQEPDALPAGVRDAVER